MVVLGEGVGDWMGLVADTHLVVEVVVFGEGVWGWMVFGCRHIPGG